MGESGPEKIPNLLLNFSIRTLNSLSPRFISFTIPAVKERSINLFLKLLNSPGKNTEMS